MAMADVQDSFPGLFLSEEGADVHFRVPSDVNKKHYKVFTDNFWKKQFVYKHLKINQCPNGG
jgi:hypothetical protein